MLSQGLNFMAIGMLTVFSFLIIMVFIMNGMYRIVSVLNKFFPEKEEEAASPATSTGGDAEAAAAIAAAYSMKN